MKTKWIVTLTIAAVLLAGCAGGPRQAVVGGPPPEGPDVTPYATLPPAPTGKAIAADGRLASAYPSVEMGFEDGASGELLTIAVKVGETVAKGDLLASIDDAELQRAVDEAQLALDRAVADREEALRQWERDGADAEKALADAQRTLTIARLEFSDTALEEARNSLKWAQKGEADAKADYEKAQTMWPPIPVDSYRDSWYRAIDEREMAERRLADAEDAHAAEALRLKGYEADVAEAEQNLAALKEDGIDASYDRAIVDATAELVEAQEALGHARLTAPWKAMVLSVNVTPGTTVSTGVSIVTLLNIEDGLLFITENLSEQHIANVYPDQRAVVTLRTFADRPLEGRVEAVVPQVDETEGVDARFTVHVRLSDTDLRLLPGLTGRVEIYTGD
ncbi:MAG: HlyD family efflux transporter periplasmic adaptor subunit [Anaerolineae bacterium]|nr:HlyD family efflux transporter periplasmic adaptor subunit [Anaerolineae bacterium]